MKKIFFLLLVFFPGMVHGVFFEFDPQDSSLGIDDTVFRVALLTTSTETINTFDIRVLIPKGLLLVDVSDGNSIINMWVDHPEFNEETGILSFSGIVPGGFSGVRGRMLMLELKALSESTKVLSVDIKNSSVYLHEAVPRKAVITSLDLSLPAVYGKENLDVRVPDTDSPEMFEPTVVSETDMFNGDKVLLFSTTDKGTGVAYYEIKESVFGDVIRFVGWKKVFSPYRLRDQFRFSHIYVRAVDDNGNQYVAHIEPAYPLMPYLLALLPCIIIGVLFLYGKRTKKLFS